MVAVLDPPAPHMVGDGFRVHNFFPSGHKLNMDPFYLLDYNAEFNFLPTDSVRGVGVHPHRGFETVTIAYQGAIAHHDSAGNSGIIYPGDVQWMTAASGILHKEYHEENFSKKGGPFQMVQLWVNLPAKDKMSSPKYQSIAHEDMAKVILPENQGVIDVIAGNCYGVSGSAFTFTPIEMYNVRLKTGAKITLTTPAHFNTTIVVVAGAIVVNETALAVQDQLIYFSNDGDTIMLLAKTDCILLFLAGEPIGEPIAQYGPFLMNKPEELKQAIHDYNTGKFGFLED